MNYTKNYHLPQWIKSDRIMMDDFNEMCRNIENGLSERNQTVDNLSGQITNVSNTLSQQISGKAAESATFERFCRAAYNHYHLAALHDPFPRQMGVFHQSFEPENVTVPGMTRWDGFCYMGKGTKNVTVKEFYDTMIVESNMTVNNNSSVTPLSVRFTPTMPGVLKKFRLTGRYFCPQQVVEGGLCRVTLHNLSTNKTEVSYTFSLNMGVGFDGRGPRTVEMNVPFHTGYDYRLKIEPLSNNYTLSYVPMFDNEFQVELLDLPSASITRVVPCEPCGGGIVLVRFLPYGTGRTITLSWNNASVPVHATRTITDERGRTFQEMEFRKSWAVPANSTLRLDLRCSNGGIALYSWGAAFI